MARTALLGIHESDLRNMIADTLSDEGYVVEQAPSAGELLRCTREGQYSLIVMDLNFGHPASVDSTIGIGIYRQVQRDVERGVTRFVGFSGRAEAVESARRQGTPAYGKPIDLAVLLGN